LTDTGFVSFFHKRFSRTVILLITMGASRADAEDATTQEAMILAWRHWDTIDEPTAWVRTVAIRRYWKLLHTPTVTIPLDESGLEPVSNSDLDMFGEQEEVLRLIRGLPPRQRTVIALYYDGSTCQEVTVLTGMPEDTVRSHLRHGRRALRGVISSEAQ
jgi:RNA polymerase sigma factor (sigma-70 family)